MFQSRVIFTFFWSLVVTTLFSQEMQIADPSLNNGKVSWLPMQIKTGPIPWGIPHEETFEIKNTSTDTLTILSVKSGRHCTVAQWTKTPICPGETGTILITYDALKTGEFYKTVTVTTSFDPEHSVTLSMTGNVMSQD